ncbi:MAG: acyltransferase [Gammaproteobacteria bacterium]|nr:acyltransferase [Gammaproteobacteria bacterium]
MFKSIYLSPLGYFVSFIQNCLALFTRPFMVYGYYCRGNKTYFKYTRISSSAKILSHKSLTIGEYCWIGHHSLIDASGGLKIGEGVQISSLNSILTHSSHISIRVLGRDFLKTKYSDRLAYNKAPVKIGDYTFIGSGAIVLPGTTIGKGCVIGAGSVVKGEIPDYSVAIGNPAKVVGTIDDLDKPFLNERGIDQTYFDRDYLLNLKSIDR